MPNSIQFNFNIKNQERKRYKTTKLAYLEQMKFCPTCRCVWEPNHLNPMKFEKYPQGAIPKYGKEEECCPSCETYNRRRK